MIIERKLQGRLYLITLLYQITYVFKVPGVRGGIVVLTWSHVRGGTVAKIFAPGGGLSWSGKNFRSGHPKIKLFLVFLARFARKIFSGGEFCPDLEFFRGGSLVLTWRFSGGGVPPLFWPQGGDCPDLSLTLAHVWIIRCDHWLICYIIWRFG